jgi:hypothetical protein
LNLAVAASGAIDSETIVLLTPEEIDEAKKKSPAYRSPGAGQTTGKRQARRYRLTTG